jgi:uncharacterized protein (UPF0276 family)
MRRRGMRRVRRRMISPPAQLGLGIGWRPQLALAIERCPSIDFVEIVAENFNCRAEVPDALRQLQDRGIPIIPHGISLNLGGADRVDARAVERLARLAELLKAPLVSEHICYVRAGEIENVLAAKKLLPVPLALENIARLFDWPAGELSEAEFLSTALEETDTLLLLDIANIWANAHNLRADGLEMVRALPLRRLAYVHVAGGAEHDGIYHDTHASPVPAGVLELLEELCSVTHPPGIMLERDDQFPSERELHSELNAIAGAASRGNVRRQEITRTRSPTP